ncbi:MAG TPA: galactosyldiacylglycerol synthase [Candidatus Polarisedimenticolia bacterium]|nr:galactosyldiacylglycerol synthase [Candidatus Polarisedimenticolia bacterium]
MIRLFDDDNEAEIGSITEDQLSFLQEQLVEETLDDYSYSINASVIGSLERSGADGEVVEMLRRALGARSSMDVRFEPD